MGSAGCICTLQTASWPPGFFVDAWRNFKGSAAACCASSVAALHPPDRPLQNIDRGSSAAKVVVRRAAKTGLSFMRWRRPLTIVSAHVDFQLCDETAPTLLPHPWELGGGWAGGGWGAKNRADSSLQRGADSACSPSLQLTVSEADSAALSRPPPATSGQPHNALHTTDSGLNQGTTTPPPPLLLLLREALRDGAHSAVAGGGTGLRGGGGSRWKTIADNGMCLKNKGSLHMRSLRPGFSFQAWKSALVHCTTGISAHLITTGFTTHLHQIPKRKYVCAMSRPLIYLFQHSGG